MPTEMTIFKPSSTEIANGVTSLRGMNSKNPEVGFGVVGTKMLTKSSPEAFFISAVGEPVIKASVQMPGRG